MDEVVTDLTACLEDSALPLMQFTEAFAVVQVKQSHTVPAAHVQLGALDVSVPLCIIQLAVRSSVHPVQSWELSS